ncbi:MAG: ORF6N domain-containing protein [Chthoniobacterales bacterium]
MPRKAAVRPEPLEPLIRNIRGERVILDSDLARVYGVATKVLNQAVKRSPDRFPSDFAFQLKAEEFENLRSQIVTSSLEDVDGKGINRSQIVTSRHGGLRYRPWVFTEHGALMAANVLRSERAVQMSVYVVRAFIGQRAQLAEKADVLRRLEKIDEKLLEHDESLLIVWSQIKELMRRPPALPQPPPAPKRRIGFQS